MEEQQETENIQIEKMPVYRAMKDSPYANAPYLGTYYYLLNINEPPLDDVRVRQALSMALDRERLNNTVLHKSNVPAYSITPPGTLGYQPPKVFGHNIEAARELLAEAGYPNGKGWPGLELTYNTSESHLKIAVALQQMWKDALNIDITLTNQEWKVYLATRKARKFDIVRAAWIGDYVDPNTFLSLVTSDNGNNHSNWGDSKFDDLIRQAASEQDQAARFALFQKAEKILIDEMPVIPIYFYVRSTLIDEAVKGWYPNILDYHPYQDVYLDKTTLSQP